MAMTRNERRALARKNHGMSLGEFKRRRATIAKLQAEALTITPEEARKRLAKWAAQPGRTQAEIDSIMMTRRDVSEFINGKTGHVAGAGGLSDGEGRGAGDVPEHAGDDAGGGSGDQAPGDTGEREDVGGAEARDSGGTER